LFSQLWLRFLHVNQLCTPMHLPKPQLGFLEHCLRAASATDLQAPAPLFRFVRVELVAAQVT